jgi:hypothetical protein
MARDLLRHLSGVAEALDAYAPAIRTGLEVLAGGLDATRLLSVLSRLDRGLVESRQALLPDFAVELALLEALHLEVLYDRAQLERRLAGLEEGGPRPAPVSTAPRPAPVALPEQSPAIAPPPREAAPPEDPGMPVDSTPPSAPPPNSRDAASLAAVWQDLLARAKREHPITAGFLREARLRPAAGEGVEVVLDAAYSFHHGKLEEAKHRGVLASLLQDQLGSQVSYELVLEGAAAAAGSGRQGAAREATRRVATSRGGAPRASSGEPGSRETAPSSEAPSGEDAAGARPGGTKDWYESKVLGNSKVQEALRTFEGEVLSID